MIRALVCDFGGVLTSPIAEGFRAYQKESGITPEQLGRAMARAAEQHGEPPLYALERGQISEREFGRRLQEQLEPGFDLERLHDLYFKLLKPNRPMIDFVVRLKGDGLRTALCTNNVREWEPLWRAKLPIDDVFEVVVDSAFVGTRKPEPAIYALTLQRLGLPAEACAFVDDLEVNVAAAQEAGMQGIVFRDTASAVAELESLLNNA